ncbi:hypothetical protein QBC35DRAFT_550433 [Podospora australis]|uniref:Protein kinase domain-containing protein n=1 Tax=Podospora australis TaxID=1536484 RepID=A0AAN7AJC1_9PEZI|nr:hypothetical protein QBC35DRAFT_550433 [Podospora australis]
MPTEILKGHLRHSNLSYPPDIIERFDQERWAFFPAKLEDIYLHTKYFDGGRWIMPFCRKERAGTGGAAVVDVVLVQKDMVPDILKAKLKGSELSDKEFGSALRAYLEWYNTLVLIHWSRLDEDGAAQLTHNILLEYGDYDLDEFLAVRNPPVLNREIIDFWGEILALATTLEKIHDFQYKGIDGHARRFNGWHGDIKPGNILYIQGKFKLADLDLPSAPECDPGRLKNKTKTEHVQKFDTWSFGCVLSSIATWVVLGSSAYYQYDRVRKLAIDDLIESRKFDKTFRAPRAEDAFHDGRDVLGAVKSWHKYLLNAMRRSDTITGAVLGLAESKMLVSEPRERLPSAELVVELQRIMDSARNKYADNRGKALGESPDIPSETLKALLELDRMAPSDF